MGRQKKYVRGPYKTKRLDKLEGKMLEYASQNSSISGNTCKRHQSTLHKAALARQILESIETDQAPYPLAQPQENDDEIKPCNCTNSGCLKLYCECFKNNRYCGGQCRCSCCSNKSEHEARRKMAKEQILMRNPFAFRNKVEHETDSVAQELEIKRIESV